MDRPSVRDFAATAGEVLTFLHRRLGFDLWMVTRKEGDNWIVLQSEDHGYGVEPGKVFRWADSFCSRMVEGNGPRIAPRSEDVPAYHEAEIGKLIPIKSYIGQPLLRADGSLFGTLCAIHPAAQPESILGEQDLVELVGTMLSTILQAELNAAAQARQAEHLAAEAMTDELTKLYNRRGWDRLLASEEERCSRYGHPAAVLVVDLDELKLVNDTQGHAAGDELIARAGAALRQAARSPDVVARLGGDEFGVLSAECDRAGGEALLARVRQALKENQLEASLGLAMRDPSLGLETAWAAADRLMYEDKHSPRSAR